jgi:hypothetical protein
MRYNRKNIAINRAVIALLVLLFLIVMFFLYNIFFGKFTKTTGNLKCEIVKKFSFSDENSLKEWEEKVFKNKVSYRIEKADGLSYVRALSDNAASALYYKVNIDAKNRRPVLRWSWRADKFPTKTKAESLTMEAEDDFAARVYVIFPALFITNSKVLEYVWSENLPVGTTGTSPYSANIKLIVIRQGPDKDKKWFTEERDIYSDYVKLFARSPERNIGAIAFMTNTEHTGTSAEAVYDEIEIGYKEETGTK